IQIAQFVEQIGAEARALDGLQELLGDDQVGVDVLAVQRRDQAMMGGECLHDGFSYRKCLTSTKWPATAAAAAMAGLTRCVRPPWPWRPSKLRFEVDAQRSPGSRRSAFMARHMEQPGSRHSKPASRKILSSPSFSAWLLTRPEPGTTMACLTEAATRLPRATAAAARRSSMRALVHEPMNTRSTFRSVSGVLGFRPMYCSALSMPLRRTSSFSL